MTNTPRQVVQLAALAADDKKARDVLILDIHDISIISDYFLICSANSSTQVQAIAEHIVEKLMEENLMLLRREGVREGRWILLDFGFIVVHVFQEEERNYYNLERLWGDAPIIEYSHG